VINDPGLDRKANRILRVTTEPALEPVTLDELKLFARIDSSYENDLLNSLITTARINCEKYLGRSFIEKTITMLFDYVTCGKIDLPRIPIISITSFKVYYIDGTSQTVSSLLYEIQQGEYEANLVFKETMELPYISDKLAGGYEIVYKAGYGALASDVPASIKTAIKITATEIYEGRSVENDIPDKAKSAIQGFWIPSI
jgi:uncharacterized phiE125 gp8 family phage protein